MKLTDILARASKEELDCLILQIILQYRSLCPEEDAVFLMLPRNDPAAREQILNAAISYLQP